MSSLKINSDVLGIALEFGLKAVGQLLESRGKTIESALTGDEKDAIRLDLHSRLASVREAAKANRERSEEAIERLSDEEPEDPEA